MKYLPVHRLLVIIMIFSLNYSCNCEDKTSGKPKDYGFDGTISETVLRNYLSRAINISDIAKGQGDLDEHIRMVLNIKAKFISFVIQLWGEESNFPGWVANIEQGAPLFHNEDPDIILQGSIFEVVTTDVNNLQIPARVFTEFGLTPETRNFNYNSMLFTDKPEHGNYIDMWGSGASIPDVTKLETRMWFFYVASSYIDAGIEAIHMGQIHFWCDSDDTGQYTEEIVTRIRDYAAANARRGLVLLDAHTYGLEKDGYLLLDYVSYPLRIVEKSGSPIEGELQADAYSDTIYGNTVGGITPCGWNIEHSLYLAEFDIWGASSSPGSSGVSEDGLPWIWGYDEITWFYMLSEEDRNDFLQYAWTWVRDTDSYGYLKMPGQSAVYPDKSTVEWYYAHEASDSIPTGGNQEAAIKNIWGSR